MGAPAPARPRAGDRTLLRGHFPATSIDVYSIASEREAVRNEIEAGRGVQPAGSREDGGTRRSAHKMCMCAEALQTLRAALEAGDETARSRPAVVRSHTGIA